MLLFPKQVQQAIIATLLSIALVSTTFANEFPATLGVTTGASWTGNADYWKEEFKKRNLPPTTGNGLFVLQLREDHVDGVLEGDIIVRIGNQSVSDEDSARRACSKMQVGVEETIVVKRVEDGKWKLKTLTVTPLDRAQLDAKEMKRRAEQEAQRIKEEDEKRYTITSADGVVTDHLTGKGIRLHNEDLKMEAKKRVLQATDQERRWLELDITCLNAVVSCYRDGNWGELANIVGTADKMGRLKDVERVLTKYGFAGRIEPLPDGTAITWATIWDKAKEVYIKSIERR